MSNSKVPFQVRFSLLFPCFCFSVDIDSVNQVCDPKKSFVLFLSIVIHGRQPFSEGPVDVARENALGVQC